MADAARDGFPLDDLSVDDVIAAGGRELLALRDPPVRHPGDEPAVPVAQLRLLRVLGQLDDALADRLFLPVRRREAHVAGTDERRRHRVGLDDAQPRLRLERRVVVRGRPHLFLGGGFRECDHDAVADRALAPAVAVRVQLFDDVLRGEAGKTGRLGMTEAVRQVALAARAQIRLAAVLDDVGHRRWLARIPGWRRERIVDLRHPERPGASLETMHLPLVPRPLLALRPRVGPRWRALPGPA